jgi:hypothetical protein
MMKLTEEDQLPWAKDYFQNATSDPGFLEFLTGKFTDAGGIYLETRACKVYLFPGKRVTESVQRWIADNTDDVVPSLGLSRIPVYPFYEISDEGGVQTLVHYNIMGTITLTPQPPTDARARKSK